MLAKLIVYKETTVHQFVYICIYKSQMVLHTKFFKIGLKLSDKMST